MVEWMKGNARKIAVIALCAVFVFGIAYWYSAKERPATLSQAQLQDINTLRNRLDVSELNAFKLQEKIKLAESGKTQPVTNYYVSAPTVQAGAEKVQQQIKNNDPTLPPAAVEKTDKTVVTPNTDKQKVDVYKINLDKPRGVGVYVSTESAGAMVQYKNVIGFGGPRFNGGYEIGAGYMIRF